MKTREEFQIQAGIYRTELRRRGLVFLPAAILIGAIFFVLIPIHQVWVIFVAVALFAAFVFSLYYLLKSLESLAGKCGMRCEKCSRALVGHYTTVRAQSAGVCPFCKAQLFA